MIPGRVEEVYLQCNMYSDEGNTNVQLHYIGLPNRYRFFTTCLTSSRKLILSAINLRTLTDISLMINVCCVWVHARSNNRTVNVIVGQQTPISDQKNIRMS